MALSRSFSSSTPPGRISSICIAGIQQTYARILTHRGRCLVNRNFAQHVGTSFLSDSVRSGVVGVIRLLPHFSFRLESSSPTDSNVEAWDPSGCWVSKSTIDHYQPYTQGICARILPHFVTPSYTGRLRNSPSQLIRPITRMKIAKAHPEPHVVTSFDG